jgi:hypothetical protein
MPKQYSAEIVRSDGDRSRVFTDGLRQRIEIYAAGAVQGIVISRPDKGVAWSFMAGSTLFHETPFTQQVAQSVVDPTSLLDWQEDGSEQIDGTECVRYRGRYRFPAGAAYELCFIERATGMRRRSVTFDKTGAQRLTVDWRSVTFAPPDPAVFEVPQGYSLKRL